RDNSTLERTRAVARPPLPGIEHGAAARLERLRQLAPLHSDFAFAGGPGARYRPDNSFFAPVDAFVYYGLLRQLRPAEVIEVGSGHTSALALDVNDRFLASRTRFCFVEPYPNRLRKLLGGERIELIERRVQ